MRLLWLRQWNQSFVEYCSKEAKYLRILSKKINSYHSIKELVCMVCANDNWTVLTKLYIEQKTFTSGIFSSPIMFTSLKKRFLTILSHKKMESTNVLLKEAFGRIIENIHNYSAGEKLLSFKDWIIYFGRDFKDCRN